jgi:hypothetical protein
MKKIILFVLLVAGFRSTYAQWSNTTNQFYDSLDMPVAQAAGNQKNPLVIKSEPDGGYFVIWEDYRNANGNSDIYAQKYDKDGHTLWAANGVPVATGDAPDQQYSNIGNGVVNYVNYQSVSHAASDGNGGFYITWQVYLASPISGYGVFVQHIRSDGSRVFASDGYGLAIPANSPQGYTQPQLIADGNGGFFIGYLDRSNNGYNRVMVYCYKDEGGALKRYGGGLMHEYKKLVTQSGPGKCGPYTTFDPISYIEALSFYICPDGQGGCGVVMALQTNSQQDYPAINRLARVKKDCHVTKDVRVNLDGDRWWERREFFYKKDTVVTVYQLSTYSQTIHCNVLVNDPVPPGQEPIIVEYVYTDYHINNQGFAVLKSLPVYGIEKINATVLTTEGNIDALLVTWNERNYINSKLTNWSTLGTVRAIEKYDSVPYQLTTDTLFPQLSYNPVGPAGMNRLNDGLNDVDTLLAPSSASYFYDYSLTGSGNRAFLITSLNGLSGSSGASPFYYQEAKVIRQSADSFALKINTTSDTGVVIGIGTGYDRFPYIAGDGAGNATFYYVGANGRDYVKASPVEEGGKLRWGALGLPLNSGGVSGSYYYASSPFLYMDAEGKAVVAWNDGRKTPDGYTGENVYIRHLDSLLKPNYQPPLLKTQLTIVPAGTAPGRNFAQSNPQSLNGSSNAWTLFQVAVSGTQSNAATPVAAIRDDYNLGTVSVSTYDFYNQPLRTTNGRPYLDRNYTISVTNHPAGASIHVRLIFTKAEFDSLKAHDASIHDPGDLTVIKQPSNGVAPATYTATSSDQGLQPTAWGTIENVDGNVTVISGYYIEVAISDFSNFFIMGTTSALPVTLQSFTVKAINNTALLQWETASELNNDHFDIERSANGSSFVKIGRVQGYGTTSITQHYSFTDAAPLAGNNYYRLAQVDLDNKITYSQIRLLSFNGQGSSTLKVFPNPVKSTLHIQLPQAASGQEPLQLYTITGIKVLVQSVPAGTLQMDADISTLTAGIYILRYGNETVRVVKQ